MLSDVIHFRLMPFARELVCIKLILRGALLSEEVLSRLMFSCFASKHNFSLASLW